MSSEYHAQRGTSDAATLRALASLSSGDLSGNAARLAHIWGFGHGGGKLDATLSGRSP